ncbi:MAG: CHASE4 domain-containing protein [Pseudomonadota bacterium]
MTIRKKTLGVIFSIMLVMGTIIYSITHIILMSGYLKLETREMIKTCDQTFNQMEEDLSAIRSVAGDWAPWDDTYQFIQDLNSDYIENNLMYSTISNLNVNFMIYIDNKGIVRYCIALDLQNKTKEKCDENFVRLIKQTPVLLRNENQKNIISGYAFMGEQIVLMASSPILTSKFEGPVKGTLVVGKYLNVQAVKSFEEKLKIPVSIKKIDPEKPVEPFSDGESGSILKNKFTIKRPDNSTIVASLVFKDLSERPLFVLEIEKRRDVYLQGKNSLWSFLFALVIISFVFIIAILLLLERTILYRLSKLSQDVKKITLQEHVKERVSLNGNDEITSLSVNINQMLEKIWENEKRYQMLFESASDAILLLKEDMIIDCNQMAQVLFGCEKKQIIGKDLCVFSPENQADGSLSLQKYYKIIEAASVNEPLLFEWIYAKKDKTAFDAEVNLTCIDLPSGRHIQAIIRDITQRNQSQRLMVQTEKMLSLGGLAAGMAHEINNPLAGMIQSAQVIENRLSKDLPINIHTAQEAGTTFAAIKSYMEKRNIFKLLDAVNHSGIQAAKIINNMLSFARKEHYKKEPDNIIAVLEASIDLARNNYNLKLKYDFKSIDIIREYESGHFCVECRTSSLQQVFFNIFKNSAEAMFGSGTKTRRPTLMLRVFKDDGNVQIEIKDNGPGIDEKIKGRIFEPFFTTKGPREGTGLGLSVSYFIISEDHGGEMNVESDVGKGTIFIIRLPLSQDPDMDLVTGCECILN